MIRVNECELVMIMPKLVIQAHLLFILPLHLFGAHTCKIIYQLLPLLLLLKYTLSSDGVNLDVMLF